MDTPFKVGDIITGNNHIRYGTTNETVYMEVLKLRQFNEGTAPEMYVKILGARPGYTAEITKQEWWVLNSSIYFRLYVVPEPAKLPEDLTAPIQFGGN